MKSLTCISVLLTLLLAFSACSDAGDPAPPSDQPTDLAGTTWQEAGYNPVARAVIYRPISFLVGDIVGLAFAEDGAVIYRSFGFCATPPLSYFDADGAWHSPDPSTLVIDMGGPDAWGSGTFDIVTLEADRLELRRRSELAE